jgi:hypothetical protein
MDASLVIFSIQAGVQLGRKLNEVLVDETRERALILPLGNLYGNVLTGTDGVWQSYVIE